jgi:hypothetical protein
MDELERLTATQLRDAAEVLDDDSVLACRDRADRVEAVRVALTAEATRREALPNQATS